MTNKYKTFSELFAAIASAIRGETGNEEPIVADNFPEAIDNIPTGEATNDATATADKVLAGEIIYAKKQKIIGTIPSKDTATYTPGIEDQAIVAGQYLTGKQIIKGDSNLIPENIPIGVTIFGVTGTYTG